MKYGANDALIGKMKRRHIPAGEDAAKGPGFLVFFQVEKILPLIGDGEPGITLN